MREIANADKSAKILARNAILLTATVALCGSALGDFGLLHGLISSAQTALIFTGSAFGLGILISQIFHRRIAVETVATASTAFYTFYLCAGLVISIYAEPGHHSLLVYLVWFFPLLVFNKLVNSPAVGRVLAKIITIAPLAIIPGMLILRPANDLPTIRVIVILASCLSYTCFALMLDAVTRYREAYIVERERAESLRIEAEVLESISDCFISLDAEFRLVYMNDAACAEFGVERRAALHRTIPEACPDFCSPAMLAKLSAASARGSASEFEAHCERQGKWYEMRCFPRGGRMSIFFRNITEQVVARRKLEEAHDRVREQSEFLDQAQDAIFAQDMEHHILYWNKGAERLFGWSAEEAMGRRIGEIFPQTLGEMRRALAALLKDGKWTGELSKRRKDGRPLIVESRSTLLRDGAGRATSILAINTDITERKAADLRIHNLAFHDVLTELPNRALLRYRLEAELAAGAHETRFGALLLIDLDDFKTLNDSSGHDLGDLLLQGVAARLTSCVRKGDLAARLGGDEFAVMLEGLSADAGVAAEEAKAAGEKILRACRQPYSLGNYQYDGTASVGISLFQGIEDNVDNLLKRAELAMYQAKAQGRDQMCFFEPAMEKAASARAALLADLKHAMQNQEFQLHYQPQVDSNGRVAGAEALLRWRHAERGMVPPDEFIPLAEAAGIIVDLGQWVLETACGQIAVWDRRPETAGFGVAVNVSIRQFLDARFVQLAEKALRESGANPRRLKLEITESFMMENSNDTVAKMTALRKHGIGFSMDDFGTGYSSLSQLKRLPLDQLKIDQSFVRDVMNGAKDASIVRTIITLGRRLNLAVIAEGVETEQQRKFLERHGCLQYQGYLFSPALPAGEFEDFVKERYQLEEFLAEDEPAQYGIEEPASACLPSGDRAGAEFWIEEPTPYSSAAGQEL